ncbi:MAG: lysylphosphatidylglycerol synthase transmembrane domain-containing protein [bacterium]|nr:lysylphosphatidylglycerol synthase transmembrane domain-containing protein [bacterium]
MHSGLFPMNKKLATGAILTTVLVWLLLREIDVKVVLDTISGVPAWGFFGGLFIYFTYYIFLTLRFDSLIHSRKTPFINLLGITSVHNMLNNLLPARSGELSYIYLVKKRFDLRGSEGVATLLVARIMDFIAIFSYFILAALFILKIKSIPILIAISCVLIVFLLLFLFYLQNMVDLVVLILERTSSPGVSLCNTIAEKGRAVSASIKTMSGGRQYLKSFALTALIWGLRNFMLYFIVISMGISIEFWELVFAATAMFVMVSLPIQGVAAFGTLEAGWAAGFMMVGVDKEVAISTAFAFHIILLAYTVTLGISGYFFMKLRFDDK